MDEDDYCPIDCGAVAFRTRLQQLITWVELEYPTTHPAELLLELQYVTADVVEKLASEFLYLEEDGSDDSDDDDAEEDEGGDLDE
jgi:hypothetical protein